MGCKFLKDCHPLVLNWKMTLYCPLEPIWTQHSPSLVSSWLFPCLGRGVLSAGVGAKWGRQAAQRGWGSTLDQSCFKPSKVKGWQGKRMGHLLEADSCRLGLVKWVFWLHALPRIQQPSVPLSPLAFVPVATGLISPKLQAVHRASQCTRPLLLVYLLRKPACA